jgi:hypothetical protein
MTIFKANDGVRVKPLAYNISDRRVGMLAIVTRIDPDCTYLPVRIEYQDGQFNWTNHESLEMVKEAPSQHEAIGKEILDRMVALKESIKARDAAVKLVVDQTETLDALLAQYGLKRGEAVPAVIVPTEKSVTAYEDFLSGVIEEGFQYRLTKDRLSAYLTNGRVYTVTELDIDDENAPVAFDDNDGDDYWAATSQLKHFTRVK